MKYYKFLSVLSVFIPVALIVLAVALTLAGCKGMIFVKSIDPSVQDITARHDTYVEADATLSPAEKRAFVGESKALRDVVEAAK